MISVERVEGKEMSREFLLFPWRSGIYDHDPAWVPPLIRDQRLMFDRKKGYFFEIGEAEFFLAVRDGRPVGRITAHVNHLYEEKYDQETGFFGFFEAIQDLDVARALFDRASLWLQERGKKRMNGPQSFSIYDSVGFEVAGKDIMPAVGLFHFAPYYEEFATACGFTKCIDWHCFVVKEENYTQYAPYLREVKSELLRKTPYQFTTLKWREINRRVREIRQIFNIAWEGNWGHLPLTDKQLRMFAQDLKLIAIPELAIFAEKDGQTVGFIISLPDVNPALRHLNGHLYPWRLLKCFRAMKGIKRVRTIIMGVLPEHQGRHIDDILYLRTIEDGIRLGYTESDCSLIVETNRAMIRALRPLAAKPYKTYRVYERPIT